MMLGYAPLTLPLTGGAPAEGGCGLGGVSCRLFLII